MKLSRIQFRKRYKKPDALIEGMMLDWKRHIQLGNKPEIMLSEIPHYYYESEQHNSHHVRFISGYRVHLITNDNTRYTVAAYSPLIGGFIGSYSTEYYGAEDKDMGLYCASSLSHLPLSSGPLDDDTSRLILMADCIPSINVALATRRPLYKWMFRLAMSDDMMLNLVSCIRQQPQEKRDRLMVLLDKYGAPEGPLGEALMHIDKFRSM